MTTVKIEITGMEGFLDEVVETTTIDSFRLTALLDEVLREQFLETQLMTHIISGSLKASGKTSSEFDKALNRWQGTIEYGGPLVRPAVPGPPPPMDEHHHGEVVYAIYEMARGGEHDFFRTAPLWEPRYELALLAYLKGE